MKKYNKVTDIEVLKKYNEVLNDFYAHGCWINCVSIEMLASKLKTSKYQIKKSYNLLKEKGYMKLEKICTYSEDYDNGLYSESVPILFTRAYIITNKGYDYLKELHLKETEKK